MRKLYLGIVRDHSVSMRYMGETARQDYNTQLEVFKKAAAAEGISTIVSVMQCGISTAMGRIHGFAEHIQPLEHVKALTAYSTSGSSTPLYDAVGDLAESFEEITKHDPEAQVLIMVLTDGEENSSSPRWKRDLAQKIQDLQKKGNWSFTFRVPYGSRANIQRLGVHAGNIVEWDTNSQESLVASTQMNVAATETYMRAASTGVRSSSAFYTNIDNNKQAQATIQATMLDVSSTATIYITTKDEVIKPFLEKQTGKPFLKGSGFYQLTKTEDAVQDYKLIMIQNKKTGAIYVGDNARSLLGLPTAGTHKVRPGDHKDYEIFIQSTSLNRKLPGGTKVVVWSPTFTPAPAAVAKPVVRTPVQKPGPVKTPTATKLPHQVWPFSTTAPDQNPSYKAGYKDGRNKYKNLWQNSEYNRGFADGKAARPAPKR